MNLKALRKIRKLKKVTQDEMALALGYSGKSSYSALENGKIKIRLEQTFVLKNILNLSDEEYEEIFLKN